MANNNETRGLLSNGGQSVENENVNNQDFFSSSNSSQRDPRIVVQRQGKPQQRLLLFLHFGLKLFAFFFYIFSGLMGTGFKTTFVLLLLVLSIDFWMVKNLCGRLLAGLRWWSFADASGKAVWRFEKWSREDQEIAYNSQVNMFWLGLILQQLVWTTLLFSAVFTIKFGWFVFTVIACSLNGANLIGYIRCRFSSQRDSYGQASGLMTRMGEAVARLFGSSGGQYMKGQAVSEG